MPTEVGEDRRAAQVRTQTVGHPGIGAFWAGCLVVHSGAGG